MNWSKVWDVIAWIGFAIVMLYFFLKIIGVLHSPIVADTLALLGGGVYLGRYMQKITHLEQRVNHIEVLLIQHIEDTSMHIKKNGVKH